MIKYPRAALWSVFLVAAVLIVGSSASADGKPWLGVHISNDSAHSEGGVLVERVLIGSPAERAGVLTGDVIVEIDGETIRDSSGLRKRLRDRAPGDRVAMTVERDGSRRTIDVRLGESPAGIAVFSAPELEFVAPEVDPEKMAELGERMTELYQRRFEHERLGEERLKRLDESYAPFVYSLQALNRPLLGVELVDVTPELRRHLGTDREAGVLVGRVMEDSAAERADVRVGDLILAIDGKEVASSSELARLIRARAGDDVVIEVLRDGRSITLDASLPERERPDPSRPRAALAAPAVPAHTVAVVPLAAVVSSGVAAPGVAPAPSAVPALESPPHPVVAPEPVTAAPRVPAPSARRVWSL